MADIIFSKHKLALQFLLLLVFLITVNVDRAAKRARVRIINEMKAGSNLTVHCKSKNIDMGIHEITYKEFIEFKVWPNFFSTTTLFSCGMEWENSSIQYIEIYKGKRDMKRCRVCLWVIKISGPCMLNIYKTRDFDICYEWNNKTNTGIFEVP